MPWVSQLPSGKWRAVVRLPDGRRMSRSHRLKGAVVDWAVKLEASIAADTWRPENAVTLTEWATTYLPTRRVEPETLALDEGVLRNHITPGLGGMRLQEIRPSHVAAWLTTLDAGPGATVRAYKLLHTILDAAVADEIIVRNPATAVDTPKPSPSLARWWTHDQVDAIVAALTPPYDAWALLMAWSGPRWGEVAGLRVSDVDLPRRRVRIQRTVTKKLRIKAYPKSSASVREIPVPPWVATALDPHVRRRFGSQLLFPAATGEPFQGDNWRRVWYAALHRIGMPRWGPHSLRHTAASWMVQAGVPLYEVQHVLGHGSIHMVQRYAHLAPGEFSRVEAVWAGDSPVTHDHATDRST